MMKRLLLSALLVVSLLSLAACGGGSATLDNNLAPSNNSYVGVTKDGFSAVRFNDEGYRDSALNSSLEIVTTTVGNETTVAVAINDSLPTMGVMMELNYDASRYTPVESSFSGLVDTPLEMAVLNDIVSLGQIDLTGEALRTGEFAVVTFVNQANRTVSAAGDSHQVSIDTEYAPTGLTDQPKGFTVTDASTADGDDASVAILGLFMAGDGDDNGESNIADLAPLGAFFTETVTDEDYSPAGSDFDGNGEVNISDLSPLGDHFQEVTTGIEIFGSDSMDMTDPVSLTVADFDDGVGTNRNDPTTTWSDIWRNWTIQLPAVDLEPLDVDEDGIVYVSAATTNGTTAYSPLFNGTAIAVGVVVESDIRVTGFDLQIDGADYTGTGWQPIANTVAEFSIVGISGNYDSDGDETFETPFTAADSGTIAGYNLALEGIQNNTNWLVTSIGETDMRSTAGVLAMSANTGGTSTATVFPDDDPQSTGTEFEGTLTVNMFAASTVYLDADLEIVIDVDVAIDPDVPEIVELSTDAGLDADENHILNTVGETMVTFAFNFGAFDMSADLANVGFELWNNAGGNAIQPNFVAGTTPGPHEYVVVEDMEVDPKSDFFVLANISQDVELGSNYSPRLMVTDGVTDKWSSINYPDTVLVSAGVTAQTEYILAPPVLNYGPNVDFITILYPDPVIRRDPSVDYTPGGGTTIPDQIAFDDILKKVTGQMLNHEFAIGNTDNGPFPAVRMADVSVTPLGDIDKDTAGDGGVYITKYRDANRIEVDIAVWANEATSAMYGYRVFAPRTGPGAWPSSGTGVFVAGGGLPTATDVDGIDFGVNALDTLSERGGILDIESAVFTDKAFNTPSLNTDVPDVLFIKIDGGEWCTNGDLGDVNCIANFDNLGGSVVDMPLHIRGAFDTGEVLVTVDISLDDLHDGTPGGTGFIPDTTYTLKLINQGTLDEDTFADTIYFSAL